jgi:hypothetical protein
MADLIFKNQAAEQRDKSGQFVNDLLRTEFHKYVLALFTPVLCSPYPPTDFPRRKFMSKFIKVSCVLSTDIPHSQCCSTPNSDAIFLYYHVGVPMGYVVIAVIRGLLPSAFAYLLFHRAN